MPPYTATMRKPVCAPSRRASASIWTTSSRVGAMISTRGAVTPLGAGGGVRRQRVKAAMRKAAVLPVPVWDCPATSLPLRASGSAASWIGVAVTKPASRTPRITASGRSSDAKSMPLTSAAALAGWPADRDRRRLRRLGGLPAEDPRGDNAELVQDAQRPGHQRLVDDVRGRREHRRDDEVDQDGVLAVLGQELRRHHADHRQERDDDGHLED